MTDSSNTYTYGKYILATGVVIFAIGQSLLFIIVAPMARSIGLSEMEFGITFSLANVSLIFAAPYWGRKSDAIGRKPVFIIGLFGSGVGTWAMAYTLHLGLTGVVAGISLMAVIFLSRIIYGLTASAIYPSAAAYIADVTNWQNRARGMALIGSANSMGSILGPAIGGGLAFMGVLFPMYAAAAISVIGALAAIIWLREPEQHRERKANKNTPESTLKFTDPRLRPYMIMWATFFVIFISLNFVTAFYIQDRFGVTDMADVMRTAGMMLACMAIVITLIQGILFQFIKLSPQFLLRLCAPSFSAGLFTMAFAPSLPFLGAGFALLGVAFACATPGISGSASLTVEPHEQGAAAGYLSAANTTGAILGPIVGTSLYKLQPNAPMLIGGTLMAIVGIYALTIPAPVRRDRK
ncbi:MAG: MFS transporter [Gammaproteobacteria bacterium]|nr:MAG: MFS transporter [Gammaproteobacteria bacterium]